VRSEINEVVALSTTGAGVGGARVQINHRDGSPATIWADATGPDVLPNPLVSVGGQITGWLDDGSYTLLVTSPPGTVPGPFDPTTVNLEIVNGDAHVSHIQSTTNAHGISDTAAIKGYIKHGSDAAAVRPQFGSVEWIGAVEPLNAVDGDTWVQV
jgi:hypothetical protein